ncbi:unnamed protein product [Linum tenue]|uniref:Uncharacterized protein n=1 Tax=Linum tenue TaxID=586396 RepID=A0AAV0HYY6_9ROSI|nr:unnamed protein product [Linum tenue]CAI0404743.1 unnamed protein product [Linum tenue]
MDELMECDFGRWRFWFHFDLWPIINQHSLLQFQ